ncbi:BamA/TamA family outer membrane protein [Tamlana sp. 2_MG-2023]|uniref:BamA/TamA family outer membrane protein n=1 Tax=unclassified Tamlana TaxID=2614803 RepID=UPI0026E16F60|nr:MULTISPECIES: BamA/TamA family outer membrane protein [unclassified Tamlana]MDO6760407.1 BamA/TamA family outer membrane protein [Tamlana sp. 2_MG-2023]MDO6789894.1 BamA/TamA family outer membrane protein [Tamlana sp. 1_MG-2023]
MAKRICFFVLQLVLVLYSQILQSQSHHKKITLKDSIDGAIDLSDYIIYANGFLVVPTLITEPALGGVGGALVPVFLKKHAPIIDENGKKRRINPDMTGALAMYTANKSWLAGGFRVGTFIKPRINYKIMAAYGHLNLSFYETLPFKGDQEFKFNFKSASVYVQALKEFRNFKWSAGPQYLFLNSDITLPNDNLPNFVTEKDLKSSVSQLGGAIQFDGRDNVFTPDKGVRFQSDFFWSNSAIGSDYSYWRLNYSLIGYYPITKKIIAGIRFEGAQVLNDPPFYLKPSINLRGVPAGRYQGNATLVTEAEFRFDVYKRWSVMLYGGVGDAFDEWDNTFNKSITYNYGSGFRYLIARKFKLRMGMDIAKGPEQWAYYVVFGSNWMR